MAARTPRIRKTVAARQLRANPTPAEAQLWKRLRGGRLGGFKFRRQQPLGLYIADFFCADAKLVVELDGAIHNLKAGMDVERTKVLEAGNLNVIRFTNAEVDDDLDAVLERILDACRKAQHG